jgi:hypothetical protein
VTIFQINVNQKSGAVTIFMEAQCGLKPILVCAELEGVREFAEMLLNFYNSRKKECALIEEVSDGLLKQALGNNEYFVKEIE